MADMDNSGSISSAEAFLLGTALSLDAFGAGIGAAMMGFPPVPTAFLIALMSALFLRLGMWIGFSCAKNLKIVSGHICRGYFDFARSDAIHVKRR